MKINIKKISNKQLIILLLDRIETNAIMLNDKYQLGVSNRLFIADNDTNLIVALGRKETFDFIKKNNLSFEIEI